MKIFTIKNVNIPENWSNFINKDGILEYFTKETGYKKTKKFSFVDVEIPENPSWLEIVLINIQYGENIAVYLADRKVAGIVAWSYVNAKTQMYLKSKEHWEKIEREKAIYLFENFAIHDYFLGICGIGSLDVTRLDDLFGKIDANYNPYKSEYNGKPVSLAEYTEIKYGKDFSAALQAMI